MALDEVFLFGRQLFVDDVLYNNMWLDACIFH